MNTINTNEINLTISHLIFEISEMNKSNEDVKDLIDKILENHKMFGYKVGTDYYVIGEIQNRTKNKISVKDEKTGKILDFHWNNNRGYTHERNKILTINPQEILDRSF